jgi:hypothetical protein
MLCSFVGFPIISIAWIFSGFASIPLADTKNPRSCPVDTPKEHFVGLSLSLYLFKLSKVSARSLISDSYFLVVMTMSSM